MRFFMFIQIVHLLFVFICQANITGYNVVLSLI